MDSQEIFRHERLRCTFCENAIPPTLVDWDAVLRVVDAPQVKPGSLLVFDGCPCGQGRYARYESFDAGPGPAHPPDGDSSCAQIVADAEYRSVEISSVMANPRQPRRHFDQQALEALAASILRVGLLEDIMVRPVEGHYEIVMGERRWRASKMAGLETIAVKCVNLTDAQVREIALIENLQREDLTKIEEAFAFKSYLDEGTDIQALGDRLGHLGDLVGERLSLLRSSSFVRFQAEKIERLEALVASSQAELKGLRHSRYDVEVVDTAVFVERVAEGYELVAQIGLEGFVVRKKSLQDTESLDSPAFDT